jgi:hypothetical protein
MVVTSEKIVGVGEASNTWYWYGAVVMGFLLSFFGAAILLDHKTFRHQKIKNSSINSK